MFSCSRGESEQLTLDSGSVVSLGSAPWRCPKTLAFTCVSAVEHVSVRLVTFGTRSLNDGLVQMCPPMSSVRGWSNEHCMKRADAQQPCGQHQKAPEETMLQPAPMTTKKRRTQVTITHQRSSDQEPVTDNFDPVALVQAVGRVLWTFERTCFFCCCQGRD